MGVESWSAPACGPSPPSRTRALAVASRIEAAVTRASSRRTQRNELGSVAAIQAEYLNHGKASLSTREPSDLLLAGVRQGSQHCGGRPSARLTPRPARDRIQAAEMEPSVCSDASDDAGFAPARPEGGAGLLAADRASVGATEPSHDDHSEDRRRMAVTTSVGAVGDSVPPAQPSADLPRKQRGGGRR
jgi:hypothetical protein